MSPAHSCRNQDKEQARPKSALPEKITAYLTKNPGVQLYKIVEGVNASRGAVTYQLRVMAVKGVIKVHEETGCRRYYPQGFTYTKEDAVLKTFLENETKAEILRRLQETPGLTRTEIADLIKIPENTIYRHITALFKAGLIKRVRDGHKWQYYLTKQENS